MIDQPPQWLDQVRRVGQSEGLLGTWRAQVTSDARTSAVLMLFGEEPDGEVDVVLTQRAEGLRKHPGQVSFPGGRVERSDASLTATALREAQEEIGLEPRSVQVLGELKPVPLAVTNFVVHPVLAWWRQPGALDALDPGEVARALRVPVSALVAPENRFTVTHPRGFEGPAFETHGLYIWGFTAFVLDAVFAAGGIEQPWDRGDRRQVLDRFLS